MRYGVEGNTVSRSEESGTRVSYSYCDAGRNSGVSVLDDMVFSTNLPEL